jgi:hypothetical protein
MTTAIAYSIVIPACNKENLKKGNKALRLVFSNSRPLTGSPPNFSFELTA